MLFFIVAVPIYIPTTVHEGSLFSSSSPTLVVSCLFDDSLSGRCEVLSHTEILHVFPCLYRGLGCTYIARNLKKLQKEQLGSL